MTHNMKNKKPSLLIALIPVIFLIVLLSVNVWIFGDDTISGSNQLTLLFAASVAAVLGVFYKVKFKDMLDGAVESISSAMGALIILLLIGSLAGTWMMSGIVPSMIFYGLELLNPTIFLVAACIICSIVSLATGSSWSTIATIGIAMLGIGNALGINDGLIGGAIISGAYFGDKMSPLSDTTNLAPAMAGTDLISHIKYMMWTTIPSITITLIIFLIIGINLEFKSGELDQVAIMQSSLSNSFNISLWSLTVPLIVIVLIIKKTPAIPALLLGAVLGGLYGVIFQPNIIQEISGEMSNTSLQYFKNSYISIIKAMTINVDIDTQNLAVNKLISTSGMSGMLNTIWLIICAMSFGGVMEKTGFLNIITESLMKFVNSRKSLFLTTSGTCLFLNITASDQYLAIVVPGRMFASSFKKYELDPKNLSRTLEDTATVTSPLIPWNTCGATHAGVLGISTFIYLPYCFFNLISPIMTLIFAYGNIKIAKLRK
jgi:NhaC family Na+:H+ antiporter